MDITYPDVHVYRVEYGQESKTPSDAIHNDSFARGKELVDNGAEEK